MYSTATPLWRNGPPEKPVLCNACGSRWRTKGTLTNYTPLHARVEPTDSENYRKVGVVKPIIIKTKEKKLQKRKLLNDNAELSGEALIFDQNFRRVYEEDTTNRSSSGSATSYSESCVHVGSTDASDLTDLYSILHQQQSSCLTGSLEEDLLFETGTLMDSVEIGHGGVLIKHLNVVARDEESVASSLPIDSKEYITMNTYSRSAFLPAPIANKGISTPKIGNEKVKRFAATGPQQAAQEHTKRDKFSHDKVHILQNKNSPLTSIDLIDVVCFEKFVRNFSPEEQQHLMKLLPSIDTAKLPDSLKSMFDSPQFVEAVSSFQHLLLEGIFDLSFSEVKIEECRTVKRLALVNMTKSKWVEHYELLKFTDDNQDLLFDVPSYASFPEAELLDYHPLKQKNPPKGSLIENRNIEKEETLSTYPSLSFIG
ncbi:zinc finger protein [Cinnamomum micranthum f. kanehirae]|uniref:Zinc finger protein n=1 Tax=Cinnamomum micranthum f. kanehirae TaxID=337451 RepID=A0A3S3MRF6_9MAGN|nr:zinc finger protein [Cinnamomum micranthum f. kanehirae]